MVYDTLVRTSEERKGATAMTTFFLFGRYTSDSIRKIDPKRTKKAEEIITGYGGTLKWVYALLGEYDLLFMVELPGIAEAVQASLSISAATGIAVQSAPAIPVALFDDLAVSVLKD
jgi:uncharacterized protein with GYD domain